MRSRWFNVLVLLCLLAGGLPASLPAAMAAPPSAQDKPDIEVEPELRVQLMAGQTAGYLIYFRETPDLSPAYAMEWVERGRFVADTLRQTAERSQAEVRAYLDGQGVAYQSFWVDNVILVESSSRPTFTGLLDFSEIAALRQRRTLALIEPQYANAPAAPQGVEPNIAHVQADQVWSLGYTGKGVVVANVDTGVRYTHETLVTHYRGNENGTFNHNYNWWDPSGDLATEPGDGNSHGTHTMGTMVGDDGGENRIGMAPGAKWMACRGCAESAGCTERDLLECGQFIAAPWDLNKNNSNPDMRPNVVNNSWGDCDQSYDSFYQGVVDAWQAAGIYPVFSNGNAGNCSYPTPPGPHTVGNPARYGNVTGVGSTGLDNGQYAVHSNWGPTDDPDTINPKPGWADLKPQVMAPGVGIRSSVNGSDIDYMRASGTSMSAPHVVGLIALMWEAAPCLIGDYATTETIIEETATPIPYDDRTGNGERSPNYVTGWGEINALEAVMTAAGYCGDSAIAGRVTDAATQAPIAGAVVTTVGGVARRKVSTAASGDYSMKVFAGAHTLQAAHYGYRTTTVSGVIAATGVTTTRDIALPPAALYEVSGQVTDAATGWPLYAHIAIDGKPLDPLAPANSLWTDPVTGRYSVMLAEGVTYTLKVTAWVAGYHGMARTVAPLTQDTTESFALQADGFACSAPGYTLRATALFSDSFEAAVSGTFPAGGWDQVNVSSSANGFWLAPTLGTDPPAAPRTGNRFASFGRGGSSEKTRLWRAAAGVDLTGVAFPRAALWFLQRSQWYGGSALRFQVSTDAGGTWDSVGEPLTLHADQDGWQRYEFDLGAYAGESDVRIGLLGIGGNVNLHVDDVRVLDAVCEAPSAGGLLVGNVYDGNYPTLALNGATVTHANGAAALAAATPDDAAVADGFYTLFAPAGAQSFTVTPASDHYGTAAAQLTMADGAVTLHDFSLPAGALRATATGIAVAAPLGQTGTSQLWIGNDGRRAANFELFEILADFTPRVAVNGRGEWLYRSAEGVSLRRASGETTVAYPSAYRWTPAALAAANVLIYTDDELHLAPRTLLDQALQSLGVAYTAHYDGDLVGFAADLDRGGPWDLVIFQSISYYSDERAFSAMMAYLQNGGALAVENLIMREDPDNPLYAEMGVAYVDSSASGLLHWWNPSHRLFQVLDAVPEMLVRSCPVYWMCGHSLNAMPGVSTALAGYTDAQSPDRAALVLRNDGRALFKGFYDVSALWDVDQASDGVLDDIELWRNIAYGLLHGWENESAWLAAAPAAGSIPALTNQSVTLNFDAAAVDQPGEYGTTLLVRNDTPYGDLHVPVTLTVTPPTTWGKVTGTVVGLGVCDADPAPLAGAPVQVESAATGQKWTLATDENGVYALWLDRAQSPLTVTVSVIGTASVPDYFGATGGVVIVQGQTTTVDFDLRLLQPCLARAASGLAMTLAVGEAATASLTLSNTGAAAAEYEFVALNGAFAPVARLRIPRSRPPLLADGAAPALGVAPLTDPPASAAPSATPPARRAAPGTIAYGSDPNFSEFVSLEVAAAEVVNVIGKFSGDVWAGDFGPDGVLYAIVNTVGSDSDILVSVDPATGAQTPLGLISLDSGFAWTGMALDPTSLTMYASASGASTSNLYVIDLTAPAARLIGEITNAPVAIALAADDTGQLYTYDTDSDMLVRVDKATGAGAVVGYIGFDARFGQGMDFDETSGQMLMAAINMSSRRSELRAVDLATGATALVGFINGGSTQLGWLALPNVAPIPWLSAAPSGGAIAADAAAVVDLTFAAAPDMQPGVYHGALRLRHNAPNDFANMPLTLTVSPPDSWGKVAGVVAGLGVCDADPAPLAEAAVQVKSAASGKVVWSGATDKNGAYQFWYDPADNPVTITVSAPDYFGAVGGVTATPQQTTTVNLDLRLLQPCLTFDPVGISTTVRMGAGAVASFTLRNTGAVAAGYRLVESDLGSMAAPDLQLSGAAPAPLFPARSPRAGAIAYGATYKDFVSLDVTNPISLQAISAFTRTIRGADFGPDGMLYAAEAIQHGGYRLISIDPKTGAQKVIAPITYKNPGGRPDWADMALDPTTGRMYIIGANYDVPDLIFGAAELYTLDLKTGAATYVGRVRDNPGITVLAVDHTGQMYAGDDSTFLRVDKATGAGVVVHTDSPSGTVAGMDFDEASHQMYVVVWGSLDAQLYTVDCATGVRTLVGTIGSLGLSQALRWFALPNPVKIPWLTETPVEGVLPADSATVVTLNFAANESVGVRPGVLYYGALNIESDAANDVAGIPVTMTVGYPATWGKLEGVVTAPGLNGTTRTLGGAKVLVQGGMGMTWTTTSDAQGAYKVWFDEKYSPVSVTISGGACYSARTVGGVAVTAGNVTTLTTSLDQLPVCTFTLMPVVLRDAP